MKFCPTCGAALADAKAEACPECGAALPKLAPPADPPAAPPADPNLQVKEGASIYDLIANLKASQDQVVARLGVIDGQQKEMEKRIGDSILERIRTEIALPRKGEFEGGSERNKIMDIEGPHGLKGFDLYLLDQISRGMGWQQSSELQTAIKAMTSTGAGVGDEWVPTLMAGAFEHEWIAQTLVAQQFGNIVMPSNPYDVPVNLADPTVYKVAEGGAHTKTDATSGKLTLTAVKIAAVTNFSSELEEDSVAPLIPEIRASLARAMAAAMDYIIVNGDTTDTTDNDNISYYGGDITDTHRALVADGLRHAALIDNTDMKSDLGALSAADFGTLMGKLGKYATRPSSCAFFMDVWTLIKSLFLSEVQTVDKYGMYATVLVGELARIYGIPIVVTEELPKTTSAGLIHYAGTGCTLGSIVLTHLPSWRTGTRRAVEFELDRTASTDTTDLYIRQRVAFNCYGTKATNTNSAYGYNVTI